MTQIVVLSEEAVVSGVIRAAGEVVQVPDNFNLSLVRRVVATPDEMLRRAARLRRRRAEIEARPPRPPRPPREGGNGR